MEKNAKMQFTAKNLNAIRKEFNTEFRGFNHCVEFVRQRWAALDAIGKVDGLLESHLELSWIVERLNGTNDCKDGVLGRTTKGEFKARTTWTPGIVIDYLRKATRVEWLKIQKTLKEQK